MPTLRKAKRREWAGKDRFDRPRQVVQTCGPMHTFLRAPMFHPTAIAIHVLNVWNVLVSRAQRGFREPLGLFINVDGGLDLTPDSDVNLFMWGRLWRSSGCTLLGVGAHAAKQSALNSIEHGESCLQIPHRQAVCIDHAGRGCAASRPNKAEVLRAPRQGGGDL